jgi:hypothetical protein
MAYQLQIVAKPAYLHAIVTAEAEAWLVGKLR